MFNLSSRSYIDPSLLEQANVLPQVTANFPPAFIADGNTATFPDQAQDLADTLDALEVPNQTFLPTTEQATLGHGFMTQDSTWSRQYDEAKIAWLTNTVPSATAGG